MSTVKNAAMQRTSVGDAFTSETRYWGARFCDTGKVMPWKLLWSSARNVKQYTTTIRILPGKDPTHPVDWDPYRTGPGYNDFGDWIRWHWAWRRAGFGDPITFLLQAGKNLDSQNPAQLLYKNVKNAVKNNRGAKGHWGAMIADGHFGSVIGKPKKMFMVQGVVFEHAGVWFDIPKGLGEEDLPVLLDVGSDAAKGIVKHCRERFKPEEMEQAGMADAPWEQWLVNGDPIGLEDGKFFEIYPEVCPPPHVVAAGRPTAPVEAAGPLRLSPQQMKQRAFRDDDDDEDGGRDIKGYTVNCYGQVGPDAGLQYGPQLSDFADMFKSKVYPWHEVLSFPSPEEQAALILPMLRLQDDSSPNGKLFLDVVEMAWVDHKDWHPKKLNPDLWAEWVGRDSVQGSDIPPGQHAAAVHQNAGPALNRKPPSVDATLTGSMAPQAPSADGPPRRGPIRPVPVQHPAPAPEPEAPTGTTSAAEHFARVEREEQEAKANGAKPNFPTPGGATQTPAAAAPAAGGWQARLAAKTAQTPPQATAQTPAPPVDDAAGGFSAPPTTGGVDVQSRLLSMRKAVDKIPKA